MEVGRETDINPTGEKKKKGRENLNDVSYGTSTESSFEGGQGPEGGVAPNKEGYCVQIWTTTALDLSSRRLSLKDTAYGRLMPRYIFLSLRCLPLHFTTQMASLLDSVTKSTNTKSLAIYHNTYCINIRSTRQRNVKMA